MWGDFIVDNGGVAEFQENVDLLAEQVKASIPLLEGIDWTKSHRIGWYIEEVK